MKTAPSRGNTSPMKWSLPAFALNRPITVGMVLLAVLGLGVITWYQIERAFIMHIDFPVIHCYVPYFGASPQQVEREVAIPAEGEFRQVSRLKRIHTHSTQNGCSILLLFDWDANMAEAMMAVRDRAERLKLELPDDVDRLYFRRSSSDEFAIVQFALLTSQDEVRLAYWARNFLEPRLARLPGVAEVEVSGTGAGRVYVEFDRNALHAAGLSIYEVVMQLKRSNISMSVGEVLDGQQVYLVRFQNEYRELETLRDTIVGPNTLRLRDVAKVHYAGSGTGNSDTVDGKRGVFVAVKKQSQANTVEVCTTVKEELESLKSEPMMRNATLFIFDDHSQNIGIALEMLGKAGRNGGILALLVLLLFMRRIRATLIVATAIPISLVAALIAIYYMGMTLNTVTMASMIICVGLLVDNSIVVMENILRHREHDDSPVRSALTGAGEVSLAITTATLTTMVVFVPVFYLETNEMSIYMREFSAPVTVAILSSLIVSLTIIPLAASRLGGTGKRKPERLQPAWMPRPLRATVRAVTSFHPAEYLQSAYNAGLRWTVHHRLHTVLLIAAVAALTAWIPYRHVGTQRLPTVDLRRVDVRIKFDQNYDWDRANRVFAGIENFIGSERHELEAETIHTRPGLESGSVRVYLRPLEDYPPGRGPRYSTDQVRAILAAQLPPRVPGGEVRIEAAQPVAVGHGTVSVRMRGRNTQVLEEYATEFARRMRSLPNVLNVRSSAEDAREEVQLHIDEPLAADAGISPYVIARTVDFALRGTRLFFFRHNGYEVPAWGSLRSEDKRTMADLDNITIENPEGRLVPLNRLVSKSRAPSPLAINRENGRNLLVLHADVATEDLGAVKRNIDSLIRGFRLPLGYQIETGDELSDLQLNQESFARTLVLAIILIYIVMGALFESYLLPLSILTSVPLAFVGVYWSMFITQTQMDAVAFIGAILMCGVVVNNGIVIVDYINQLRQRGLSRVDAVLQASRDRFRPVMMTALTTIGGCIPLALGTRLGEVAFHSLGRALIGGLTTGTVLTLFIVPLFYTLIDDLQIWFVRFLANLGRAGTAWGAHSP